MKLRAALPMMLCLLVAAIGPRADAQLALPQVQIPDPAHTLPPLPELNAEPLLSAGDRLTGLRLDRITGVAPGTSQVCQDRSDLLIVESTAKRRHIPGMHPALDPDRSAESV